MTTSQLKRGNEIAEQLKFLNEKLHAVENAEAVHQGKTNSIDADGVKIRFPGFGSANYTKMHRCEAFAAEEITKTIPASLIAVLNGMLISVIKGELVTQIKTLEDELEAIK